MGSNLYWKQGQRAYCDGNMLMWLSRGDLKLETESAIIAAKYRVLKTKYYAENMKT